MGDEGESSGRAPREAVLTREPELRGPGVGHLLAVPLLFLATILAVGILVPDEYTQVGYALGGIAMTVVILTGVGAMLGRAQKQREALLARFTRGVARVIHVRETGLRVQRRQQFELKLEVRLPDREPFPAVHIGTGAHLSRLAEGQSLAVACDPDDHARMVIIEEPDAPIA